MSWWGGGSKSNEPDTTSQGSSFGGGSDFDSSPNMYSSGGSGDGGSSMQELQQFSIGLQQSVLVQQVITDLTQKAFTACIPVSRDNKLSGKEVACIHSTTNKWLDCNEYMMGRLARKAQAGGGSEKQFG